MLWEVLLHAMRCSLLLGQEVKSLHTCCIVTPALLCCGVLCGVLCSPDAGVPQDSGRLGSRWFAEG